MAKKSYKKILTNTNQKTTKTPTTTTKPNTHPQNNPKPSLLEV
jgi:hypothetical protein